MAEDWLVFHEDAFGPFFRPKLPEGAVGGAFGGFGLLLGTDWPTVRLQSPENVWTVSEDFGEWWILPGISFINRHCYLVTERAHQFKDIAFRSYRRRPILTALGKERILKKIARVYG